MLGNQTLTFKRINLTTISHHKQRLTPNGLKTQMKELKAGNAQKKIERAGAIAQ